MEYASRSVGNAGLTTGIIGTALGVLGGGASLLNMGGNTSNNLVNRYEMDLQMGYEKQLSDQALRIASLEAEKISDQKDVEVYRQVSASINALDQRLSDRLARVECAVNAQAVYNATNTATIGCIQKQVAQLQEMTKLVIPSSNVMTPATT